MRKIFIAIAVSAWLGLAGCYHLVAEHPEKTKNEFYEDKALCEKNARDSAMERMDDMSMGGGVNQEQRCLRALGWEFHLRKTSK